MSKEIIIAIILGFGIGLIITYGVWTANQAFQKKQQTFSPIPTEALQSLDSQNNPSVPAEQNTQLPNSDLVISQPEPNTVSEIDNLTVSGTTHPHTTVIIYTENDQYLITADEQGSFTQDIKLLAGTNYLTITSIASDNKQTTIERTIIYTTAEF